jgi:hypothetical protein
VVRGAIVDPSPKPLRHRPEGLNMNTTKIKPTGRFRGRRAAAVLAAGALCTGAVAFAAPSAQAATSISFCFKWSGGAPYAKEPVYMRSLQSSGVLATGKTAANGCATWATPSAANVYVQAYADLQDGPGYQIWNGYTQYYTATGAGQAALGTGIVSLLYVVG